jgi:outer membrane autotransporter protein
VGAINSVFFSSIPTALAQRELALGGSRTALRDFNGRLFRLRSGANVTPAQTAVTQESDKVEYHTVTLGEGDGEGTSPSGKGSRVVYGTVSEDAYRWQAFTSFDYGSLDMDADRHFLGLRSDTYAESAGVEFALSRHVALGTGVAWLQSDAEPGTDVEGITLAAYASAVWRGFYADLLYGATLLDHDIDRATGTDSTAHAQPGSVTHAVNFNVGRNFRLGGWITGPFAGVDYAHAKIDGYTESGGGAAATRVSEQSTDSLIARVGWQANRPITRSWGTITPQVRIGWERENLGSDDEIAVSLLRSPYYLVSGNSVRSTGAGFSARVSGQDRERDYFTVGAGVLAQIGRRSHLLLDYEGNLLDGGYAAHYGKVSLGWRF